MFFCAKLKKYIVGGILMACFALGFAIYQIPDNKFHIYFLDIGQGDSILIKTPENHQILIDGGPKNYVLEEMANVISFFDREIDLVVLTHPHADHIEGLIEVLKRYKVNGVLLTGVNFFDNTYNEFLKEIRLREIPVFIAESRGDFIFGDVFIDVLFPLKAISGNNYDNLNNSSVGVCVVYKNKKILLLGDLEQEAENVLLKTFLPSNVDIYKASHHGSKTASSIDFLKRILPKNVVIQVGKDNKFKHPHPETIRNFYRANIKKIYRTDTDGMVEFVF